MTERTTSIYPRQMGGHIVFLYNPDGSLAEEHRCNEYAWADLIARQWRNEAKDDNRCFGCGYEHCDGECAASCARRGETRGCGRVRDPVASK